MRKTYFAYGSNMNNARMAERCPGSTAIGTGFVSGREFIINERGVATLRDAPNESHVHGVLWSITTLHERTLDHVEGVAEGRYARASVIVSSAGGGTCEALVYLDPIHSTGTPRDGYLALVLDGAEEHGLPKSYIDELGQWEPT